MNLKTTAKALCTRILDATLVRLVRYVHKRAPEPQHIKTVLDVLSERAAMSAADYVESRMQYAVKFRDLKRLLDFALSKRAFDGIIAEFGVFQGESINYLAEKIDKTGKIYGFDSFEGLQEDWRGQGLTKGSFSLGGQLPEVRDNVELIKGWFTDTVPRFLTQHPSQVFAFIHVDCDTYEASKFLLKALGDRLSHGTIIVFDEYFGYTGWRTGEWKAWQEFVAEREIRYEYLGFFTQQVAVRIL
jgi:predicted O-methyltransferase YrrM